jgi:hypothetical protein
MCWDKNIGMIGYGLGKKVGLLYNLDKMHCLYTKCKKNTMWTLQNVKIHQLQNGDIVTPTLTLFHIYMHATSNCT